MDRNVYSLVLLDDVVDAVDKLAYERSTSRSGLINQILADYLSCPIPENRIRDIFTCMEKMFAGMDDFQLRDPPSDSMISIRSALHYRYRPTVRYALELYRKCEPYVGELRVSFRTQNEELLGLSEEFFRFWNSLETQWIGNRFRGGHIPCSIDPGRYSRQLQCSRAEEEQTNERIARAILLYIREFDSAMKKYVCGPDGTEKTEREIEGEYLDYLKKAMIKAMIL